VKKIGAYADGVVVGSAIVDKIESAVSNAKSRFEATAAAVEEVGRFIEELKKPLRR
jgi:tryptophan synthase alpha subunit